MSDNGNSGQVSCLVSCDHKEWVTIGFVDSAYIYWCKNCGTLKKGHVGNSAKATPFYKYPRLILESR